MKLTLTTINEAVQCYSVTGRCLNSHEYKGWRAMVYELGARHCGYYQVEGVEATIYYEGTTLVFKILFKTVEHADMFIDDIARTSINFQMYEHLKISDNATAENVVPTDLQRIRYLHYKTDDSTSPHFDIGGGSVKSPSDTASVHSSSDPEEFMLTIEDPSTYFKLKLYSCHLMSKKLYPEEAKNPNNILKLSWSLHQRFDGLKTIDERPQIAVCFVAYEGTEEIRTTTGLVFSKDKVIIAIEAEDRSVLEVVGASLKRGSFYDEESTSWRTFVHVENNEDFRRCLMVKYHETKSIWANR